MRRGDFLGELRVPSADQVRYLVHQPVERIVDRDLGQKAQAAVERLGQLDGYYQDR